VPLRFLSAKPFSNLYPLCRLSATRNPLLIFFLFKIRISPFRVKNPVSVVSRCCAALHKGTCIAISGTFGLIGIETGKLGHAFGTRRAAFHIFLQPQKCRRRCCHSYLQELLTILREATCISPCSEFSFLTPALAAASLASSFMLCIVTFETTPLTVTLCPT
jgi:hypothetical protein